MPESGRALQRWGSLYSNVGVSWEGKTA